MYSGKSLKLLIIRRRVSAEAKPSEVLDYCGTPYACVLYYKDYLWIKQGVIHISVVI